MNPLPVWQSQQQQDLLMDNSVPQSTYIYCTYHRNKRANFLIIQKSRYYIQGEHVNATLMKCIFSAFSHLFSSKPVCNEDGKCLTFSNICINKLYYTNTASFYKMLITVNLYVVILTIRNHTKHVNLRLLGEKLNSKC